MKRDRWFGLIDNASVAKFYVNCENGDRAESVCANMKGLKHYRLRACN
ncbi:MAG: hypothetical protein ACRCT1_20840 [Microcoleaceae cyanobacterium]